MNNLKRFKNLISATVLSVLVFLSISFVTVLIQINPIHYYANGEPYRLDIGYPFRFYEQFFLRGSEIPNSGWYIDNLLYDCVLTWLFITGLYVLTQIIRNKKSTNR